MRVDRSVVSGHLINTNKSRVFAVLFTILIAVGLFTSVSTPPVAALDGQAQVFILKLSGVETSWVDNQNDVVQGVQDACTPIGRSRNVPQALFTYGKIPPHYKTSYSVVTTWSLYKNIVESYTNKIIVNSHGEIVPVPSGYTREQWVDKIAEAMYTRRLTWVNIAGYPFYYSWLEGATDKVTWGEPGFQRLMSHIELGSVTCWSPASGLRAEMSVLSAAWTQLSSWTNLNYARLVDVTRPLKESDFKNYALLPLYPYEYNGVTYWEGAVIAYSKPGSRLSTDGFGYYIHIGTGQTYDANNNPTNKDYSRAYVATAAALWAETLQGKARSNVYIDPTGWKRDLSLHVNPVILGSWSDVGGNVYVRLAFGLYGTLSSWDSDDAHAFEDVVVYLSSNYLSGEEHYGEINMQLQSGLHGTQPLSKNGKDVGIQPITGVPFYDDKTGWIVDAFIFMLALWPPAEPVALALGGIKLFADWIQLGIDGYTTGVEQPDTWVDFWYTPQSHYTVSGDKCYGEFESLVVVDVSIDDAYGCDWRVIPISYGFHINTWSGKTIDVDGCVPIAVWLGSGNTVAVFYEDFEDSLSGWTTGDNNANSGYDYWDISTTEDDLSAYANQAWCAAVGDNSIYGMPNKEAGDPWPPRYDKNMDSYLRYDLSSLNAKAYQSLTLRFFIGYWIESGDFFSASVYEDGVGWRTLSTYTGYCWNWGWEKFSISKQTTTLEFRFYSNNDDNVFYGAYIDNIEILGVIPNDAPNTGNQDAGNSHSSATLVSTGIGYGYFEGEADTEDWYKLHVSADYRIKVNLYPQSNVLFYVEIWDPSGSKKAGPSSSYVSYRASVSGYWRIRIYVQRGFGSYSFNLAKTYDPGGGGGGCPILYVWNGTDYASEGLLDIHDPDGIDVIVHHTLVAAPRSKRGTYWLQLTEHPQTISHIDQVKLYVVLEDDTIVQLPLIWAQHSENGNVMPRLLFSDDWKTETLGADHNNGTSQTIILRFLALPRRVRGSIRSFVFLIEGNNRYFKK